MLRVSVTYRVFFLYVSLLIAAISAKFSPLVSKTGFQHLPRKYSYFEDSSTIVYLDEQSGELYISADDGKSWSIPSAIPKGEAKLVITHPFDTSTAFVLGESTTHYKTKDKGKTWLTFKSVDAPSTSQLPLYFHAKDKNKILFAQERCDNQGGFWGTRCSEDTHYTSDGFESDAKLLRKNTRSCIFALSTVESKVEEGNLVLCIEEDPDSEKKLPFNLRLTSTSNWYKDFQKVAVDGVDLTGIVGLGAVRSFLIAATKVPSSNAMMLMVSDNGYLWDRAEFPKGHKGLEEDAYTILESRSYAIQVDVLLSEETHNAFGSLYTSNSNGTYFSKQLDHTNRNDLGIVDFENVANIDGIVLANIVANHASVRSDRDANKELQSRISFNDGRSWHSLQAPKNAECDPKDTENCALHLYSAAAPHNVGRIFSSAAPGVLMGVGSVGKNLQPYHDCDLFISYDAGKTWSMTRKDAHKYEWGDHGSLLVAIYDEDTTNEVFYSIDRGQHWESVDLGIKVRARFLTTTPDSTSEKFTLVASRGKGEDAEENVFVFSLDFTGSREKQCEMDKKNPEKSDFEKWYALYDDKDQPACIMGHKQFFYRKRADRNCFVGKVFDEEAALEENCPCQDEDYECDYNFVLSEDGICVQAADVPIPKGQCQSPEDTYRGPSGYRLIPGNTCDQKKGLRKDEETEIPCKPVMDRPGSDDEAHSITSTHHDFDGHYRQYFFLKQSTTPENDEETVIMRIDTEHVYVSQDHGKTWKHVLENEEVVAVVPHKYFPDHLYFLTSSDTMFVSRDRGRTTHKVTLPSAPNRMGKLLMDFHAQDSKKLIFTGMENCDHGNDRDCRPMSFYTDNGGQKWRKLHDYAETCQYIGTTEVEADSNLIYCSAWAADNKPSDSLSLYASTNNFKDQSTLFDSIVGYAIFEEFIVVAEITEEQQLRMHASVDGQTFAHGHFPPKFDVDQRQAYTVLDSVTKSIFLHVTTNAERGQEFGSILKSNSNGTYFVTSLNQVNRNEKGFVDFEKLQGLEGVAIVNIVGNVKEVTSGAKKALRTVMTHNDGGEWTFLQPPSKDSESKAYSCSGRLETCSLSLHGYTERVDYRDTFSSGSAIGIMLGVGNVGSELAAYDDSDTFISSDGGISWSEAQKGPYQWEFGDQGSVIVIVKDGVPVDHILFSLDEGKSWQTYKFADSPVLVQDIATVPADNSRKFLLLTQPKPKVDEMRTYTIDFTAQFTRKCAMRVDSKDDGDFYLWTPSHPSNEDRCLFGHITEYPRKKPDAQCYIGSKLASTNQILQNCTCTIYDYECDYNYERASDGTCQLIAGLDKPDHSAQCSKNESISYMESTGYRRIPLTTCVGGKSADKGIEHPCPGFEDSFSEHRRGLGGFSLFLVICIPFVLAGAVTYYVWQTQSRQAFGQIRLGDEDIQTNFANHFETAQEVIVVVVAGAFTFVRAIPMVCMALIDKVRVRYSTGGHRRSLYDRLSEDALLQSDDDPLDEEI